MKNYSSRRNKFRREQKEHRRISITNLASSLGQSRCHGLVFFHAFTGCDTNSSFKNIGKKKAYDAYCSYPDIESIFEGFHSDPFFTFEEDDSKFKTIQRLVVLMYSRTSLLRFVNEARMELYFTRSQNIEQIPPTANALLLHIRRAIYQSGIWSRCILESQNCPSPQNYGWMENTDKKWYPVWMTQNEAIKETREFVKCGCKTSCGSGRCKCKAADLKCTKCTKKVSNE